MRIDILTLFPEMCSGVYSQSIIGRAINKNILEIYSHNIRDYTLNKHKNVDDTPYGGGMGMLMMAQPIYDCYCDVVKDLQTKPHVVYMSPQGKVLTQKKAVELSRLENLVILCGHYEGVDERVLEEIVDEEISVGDYVLTGGELPALVLIDCVSRMIDGVLPNEEAYSGESIYNGLLEHPQYTKPYCWNGKSVPEVLISGHHANIEKWKHEQSLKRTLEKRPDLLDSAELTKADRILLDKLKND